MMYLFIDDSDIEKVLEPFRELSDKVISLAMHRAMRRTEATVMAQSRRLLQQQLELRSQKRIRARTQTYIRPAAAGFSEMKFWFGMNNLPVTAFKGVPKRAPGGLMFRGHYYDRAFAVVSKGKRRYMQREGEQRTPITKLTIPIPDDIIVDIEDEVLARMPDIFLRHLATDLAGRSRSQEWKQHWNEHAAQLDAATRNINAAGKTPRGAR